MSLAKYSKVLILRVEISGLPGSSKLDKSETEKLTADNKTTKRHGRVTKTLFADSERASKLRSLAAAARNWIAANALPGDANGKYMVPAAKWERFAKVLKGFEDEYNDVRDKFVADLDAEITEDQTAKNGLFKLEDYPTAQQIQTHARFKWVFEPMADSDAFADIFDDDAIAADFRDKFDTHKHDLIEEARTVNLSRLRGAIKETVEKIRDYNAKVGKGKRTACRGESWVKNLKDAAQLSRDLNVTDCPETNDLALSVESALMGVDGSALKDDVPRENFRSSLQKLVSDPQPPIPQEIDAAIDAPVQQEPCQSVQENQDSHSPVSVPNLDDLDF